MVFVSVGAYDPIATAELHAALWNQGLANLLVLLSGTTVRIFSLARLPRRSEGGVDESCLIDVLGATSNALELKNLLYSTESGSYWSEHQPYFRPEERVDQVLLNNLKVAYRLLDDGGLDGDAAQALLIQTMFVAYLEDRGIIDEQYFLDPPSLTEKNFVGLLSAENSVESLKRLFSALQEDFNGDLFVAPCSFDARNCDSELRPTHLSVLARFRSGTEEMSSCGGQYRIWPYNFRYMPIELISAVHDQFLGERDNQRLEGAYYTPMHLADVVISHVWDRASSDVRRNGVFLDPACGSGVFLVRLFQRMCEHIRITDSSPDISWDALLAIVRRLRGCDIDDNAVRIAVFSLYVALLEKVTPPVVRRLVRRRRVLPQLLGSTLLSQDFFDLPVDECRVDVVVGNPPWSSRHSKKQLSPLEWCRRRRLPTPLGEVSWAFVWKSLRHLSNDGIVGLLLPAMGFLHNHSGTAVRARKRLVRETMLHSVVNFSDIRRQLFGGAKRAAALLVLSKAGKRSEGYRFDYLAPKADLNLAFRRLIVVGSRDQSRLDSRLVEEDPQVFKKRLWMTEPDARLFEYMSQFPRLGDITTKFSSAAKKAGGDTWLIGQGFQPAKPEPDPGYEIKHSEKVATLPYLPAKEFRPLAGGSEGRMPWLDGRVRRRGFEGGFEGPRVLVPGGVGTVARGRRLRAAYVGVPLTFQDAIQAVVVPRGDERRAMLLAGLLNSALMVWFAFHGTSCFGAERPVVRQADLLRLPFPSPEDMLDAERSRAAAEALASMVEEQGRSISTPLGSVHREIDDLAYEFFCLSDEQRILVEDTTEHVIPAIQPSGPPALWDSSTAEDRCAYARTLVEKLGGWLTGTHSVGVSLVARSSDFAILRLSLRDRPSTFEYSEKEDVAVLEAVARLVENVQEFPSSFLSIPDFRVFVDRDLFLIKPAGRRFWLRSAALADASAIALDLHVASSRESGVGPLRV